jgi:hypothetical protein
MDLITHIPGVAFSAPVTPGLNTPAPWNVSHTGLTDGTSPNNATKNMAEIYNRLLLANAAIIQDSGLTLDYTNWTQITSAIRLLGINHGGSCPATGPASPPTSAAPFTRYTSVSPYSEHWEWSPSGWFVTGKQYGVTSVPANVTHSAAGEITAFSFVAHRAGLVICTMHNYMIATAAAQASGAVITINGTVFAGSTLTSSNNGQALRSAPNGAFNVTAGDTIAWRSYSGYSPVTTQQIVCGLQYTA